MKKYFTMIELLIVISIILILLSILLPALQSAREKACMILCAGNLKQIGTAFTLYVNDHNEWMPGNFLFGNGGYSTPGRRAWWLIFDKDLKYLSGTQYRSGVVYAPKVMICPSAQHSDLEDRGLGTYGAVTTRLGGFTGGVWYSIPLNELQKNLKGKHPFIYSETASMTEKRVVFASAPDTFYTWTCTNGYGEPNASTYCSGFPYYLRHHLKVNAAMLDGSVASLSYVARWNTIYTHPFKKLAEGVWAHSGW